MEITTISPKFQIVIPRRIRESLGIRPGQKLQVILYEGRIELIPVKPICEARGFLQGIDTTVEREPDITLRCGHRMRTCRMSGTCSMCK